MREVGATLSAWNSFYVMIGSSAAALTGLMFVVITLVRDSNRGATNDGVSTFSTPTVVHFCCALFTSAVMSAPFRSLVPVAIILGVTGGAGSVYVVRVALRTSALTTYRPDAEDWICNVLLPFVGYAGLAVGALTLHAAAAALYAPAAAVLILIFVGIHNAWEVVTYLATGKSETQSETAPKAEPERAPRPTP